MTGSTNEIDSSNRAVFSASDRKLSIHHCDEVMSSDYEGIHRLGFLWHPLLCICSLDHFAAYDLAYLRNQKDNDSKIAAGASRDCRNSEFLHFNSDASLCTQGRETLEKRKRKGDHD